ncbi:MAG: glycosyltransferase [Muribaculaceae bacterium]|nr:glycosyltransferase [Muribaculaceae bacterium]
MEKQISIIIPTYNMEKYIGKCLDSLLIPEFDQVEVLVVNDGSKDRSSEIAHSYVDRYPGSIRVIDKPNGNYGSCINAALPLATGRYVKVLDADDTFDTEAFSKFIRNLSSLDSDVVLTSYCEVDPNGLITSEHDFHEFDIKYGHEYTFEECQKHILRPYTEMHRITYHRRVFQRFAYEQAEGISYTDNEWSILPMGYARTIMVIKINLYRYLIGREGQTVSEEQQKKNANHYLKLLTHFTQSFNKISDSHPGKAYVQDQLFRFHMVTYKMFIKMWNKEIAQLLKAYDTALQSNSAEIYNAIGQIKYTPELNYRIFSDLRKRDYPASFSIPFSVKARLSIKARLQKLACKNS